MYSRITATANGREAIAYAEGEAHNDNEVRNLKVTPINMLPNGKYADQMQPLWNKASHKHKIQVRRIILSFSKNECDPDKPEDVERANQICKEFIQKYYPNRQAVLYFQADGKGGMLHCHAIVNDVALTDYKACTDDQKHYTYVKKGINAVASQYITLDAGEKAKTKQSQTERAKVEKASEIKKQLEDEGVNLTDEEMQNLLIEEKAYSYKEDMKQRIKDAVSEAASEAEFEAVLNAKGVQFEKKTSKKYGEYYTYDFVECPVGAKNTKARSYKLGELYSPESIRSMIALKETSQKPHTEPEKTSDDVFDLEPKKEPKKANNEPEEPKTPENDFHEWMTVYHPGFVFKKEDGTYDFDAFDELNAEWKSKEWMKQEEEPEPEAVPEEPEPKPEEVFVSIPQVEESKEEVQEEITEARKTGKESKAYKEMQRIRKQQETLRKDREELRRSLPAGFTWDDDGDGDDTPDFT